MSHDDREETPPETVWARLETILLDQHDDQLGLIDGPVWPPRGAVVELGNPNRDAIVQDVRLLFTPSRASIIIRVTELDEGTTVPPVVSG